MPSFDIVCKTDLQEVKNAVLQVQKEIGQRYDFRDSKSSLELMEKEQTIIILADDKMKLESVQELLRQKFSKRGVSLKSAEFKEAKPAGGDMLRAEVIVKQGLKEEELKKITKAVKESKLKATTQIQADQIRVSSKQRDELQTVIALLKRQITDLDLQFLNFRE